MHEDNTKIIKLLTTLSGKAVLENKDKLKVDKVHVLGKVYVVTEVFSVKHDDVFCIILEQGVKLLIKKKLFLGWQELLTPGKEYVFTELKPTTLEKGAGHPIKLFVPTKNSKTYLPTEENELIIGFEDWLSECGIPKLVRTELRDVPDTSSPYDDKHITYQGVITCDYYHDLGVYELDNKIRLYTTFVPVKYSRLEIGTRIKIHNAHMQKLEEDPRIRFVCCMCSCIKVIESLKSRTKEKVYGIPKCLQSVLWRQQFSLHNMVLIVDMMIQIKRKFKTLKGKMLENVVSIILTFSTKDTIQVPRNYLQEVLLSDGSCFLKDTNISELFLPAVNEINIMEANAKLNSIAKGKHDGNRDWNSDLYWNFVVEECSEQLVFGELHISYKSGQFHLRDGTGSIDCVAMETEKHDEPNHKCDVRCCQCYQVHKSKFTCPFLHSYHDGCLVAITKYHIVIERFLIGGFSDMTSIGDIEKYKSCDVLKKYIVIDMTDVIFMYKDSQQCEGLLHSLKSNQRKTDDKFKDLDSELMVFINHKESLILSNNSKEMMGFSFICHVCKHCHLPEAEDTTSLKETGQKSIVNHKCKSCQLVLFCGKHVQHYQTIQNRTLYRFNKLKLMEMGKGKFPWQLKQSAKKAGDFMCHVLPDDATLYRYFHNQASIKQEDSNTFLDKVEDILCEKFDKDYVSVMGRIVRRVHQPPDERGILRQRFNYNSEGYIVDTLGHWQIQLQLKCQLSGKEISVYLKLENLVYPLAMLPGAVICIERLERKVSRKGIVYCNYSTVSSLRIVHHSWSTYHAPFRNSNEQLPDQAELLPSTELPKCYLCDVWLHSSVNQFFCFGSIQKVTKISLKCVCQTCGTEVIGCCTNTQCGSHVDRFVARLSVIIDDGTSVAMVTCADEMVRQILILSDDQWEALIQTIRGHGEVFLQQTFPESGSTLEKFVYILCDNSEIKQPLKWSLQCKQMTCDGKEVWKHPCDLLKDMSPEDFPVKTVETGISTIRTKSLPMLQMRCLAVTNINYREQCMHQLKQN